MNNNSSQNVLDLTLSTHGDVLSMSNTAVSSLECLINFAALPVSVPNFLIIFRTQIIHKNLKFILLCQCLSVTLFAVARIFDFGAKIVAQNMIYQSFVICSSWDICIIFGDLLLLCLFCERCMATKFVRNYERRNSAWFPAGCSAFLFLSTLTIYLLTENFNSPSMVNKRLRIKILAVFCFTVLCILIYLWHLLYKYNCRLYVMAKNVNNVQQHLSERYQLSENIRTFRQLFPSVVLHFFIVFLTLFGYMSLATNLFADDLTFVKIVSPIMFLLFAIANLLIQITVIIFHPILNRSFSKMLRSVFARQRNNRINDLVEPVASVNHHVPTDINGKNLMMTQGAEDHFRMLQQSWR